MTFLPECGTDKKYFISDSNIPTHLWIHNDSMYVRFGGIRNTKTWSKSTFVMNPTKSSFYTLKFQISQLFLMYAASSGFMLCWFTYNINQICCFMQTNPKRLASKTNDTIYNMIPYIPITKLHTHSS